MSGDQKCVWRKLGGWWGDDWSGQMKQHRSWRQKGLKDRESVKGSRDRASLQAQGLCSRTTDWTCWLVRSCGLRGEGLNEAFQRRALSEETKSRLCLQATVDHSAVFDTVGPFLQLTEFGFTLKGSGNLYRILRRETIRCIFPQWGLHWSWFTRGKSSGHHCKNPNEGGQLDWSTVGHCQVGSLERQQSFRTPPAPRVSHVFYWILEFFMPFFSSNSSILFLKYFFSFCSFSGAFVRSSSSSY